MPQPAALKNTAAAEEAEHGKIKFFLISDSSIALCSQILSIFQSFHVTALTLAKAVRAHDKSSVESKEGCREIAAVNRPFR